MKWTTANIKHPNYTQNHEIYVGTHTGSFKKLNPGNSDSPFHQKNLCDLSRLKKESKITTLEFGNDDQSEILIGRADQIAQLHSLLPENVQTNVEFISSPIVGLVRYDEYLISGFGTGQVQKLLPQSHEEPHKVLIAGDDMSHMRQCRVERKLVATGGKGRKNNLKIFDMESEKQIFTSKNLPNDFLQLEVPVWDSDVGFIDPHTPVTCSRYGYVRVYDIRKQRRPVQAYSAEEQMSFTTLAARDNYIYSGTTMGVLKAFDIRHMKNFVHTYKGFTGSISDLHLDETGKFLASASLDRYVRVHDVTSCVLQYQCYVKSKATRLLIRESAEKNKKANDGAEKEDNQEAEEEEEDALPVQNNSSVGVDDEYDALFDKMQTVSETLEEDNTKIVNKRKQEAENKMKRKKKKNEKIGE